MALGAMCCLKNAMPKNCHFFVVCSDNLAPLYESISWVKKVIRIGSGHASLSKEKLKEISDLKAGMGFLFVNSFRSAWYFRKILPKVYGASNGLRNILLTKSFPVKWHKKKSYSSIHQSQKYLSMVYELGCQKWDGKYPEFQIEPSIEKNNQSLSAFLETNDVIAVAPGAAYGPAKRWNSSYYNKVCRFWIEEKKGKVLILGAQNESDAAKDVISNLNQNSVLNLTGKTSLKELIYILKKVQLCISNDSGIMHLGSALDIKGIAIFTSTDPFATGPLSKNWTVLLKKQYCSPCFSRVCINPQKNYNCLNAISPDEVIEILKRIQRQMEEKE